MRWPRRGILIRLFIYVPLIAILAWRAQGGCAQDPAAALDREPSIEEQLAPHRTRITLPDGTQQEIVELTPEQAEQILGHPVPDPRGPAEDGASDATAGPARAKAASARGSGDSPAAPAAPAAPSDAPAPD